MRRSGILLLMCGVLIGLGYFIYWFQLIGAGGDMSFNLSYLLRVAFHFMPLWLKVVSIAAIVIGLILLLISIVRRRLTAYRRMRKPGVIIAACGLLAGLGYLLHWFHGFGADSGITMQLLARLAFVDFMPLSLKVLAITALASGLLLLLFSLVKGRYTAFKSRKPELVEQ